MSNFSPCLSFDHQSLAFNMISLVAFVLVVSFFLYENSKVRSLSVELVLAVSSALCLGTAIFFGLIRTDVIL